MAFHHTLFQLSELLTWWHLKFTSASRQRIWWQVHSPRNKWTLNVQEFARLTWPVQLTGACKRIETDQQLQLQTHGVNARCCQGPLQSREFITMYSCWYSFVHEEKSTSTSISGTTSSPTPNKTCWVAPFGCQLQPSAAPSLAPASATGKGIRQKNISESSIQRTFIDIAIRFSKGICKKHLVKW